MDSRPLALITGASSGIGLELAAVFAEHGYDLVLCAEDPGIADAAARCRAAGVEAHAVQTDLRQPSGVEELYAAVTGLGRGLDAAALNAGVGRGGSFLDASLEQLREVIDLNVTSTVHLAHLVLGDMVRRGSGRVLITSSIASTMPGSYQAVYNASKAFLQSLAAALVEELKDTGVTVTALMPGPTETEFFTRADMDDTAVGQATKDDPAQVARQGFDALVAGDDRVVGGSVKTKAQELANKVLPDRLKAAGHAKMAEPGSGD